MSEPRRTPDSGCGWGKHRRLPWTELDDWDRMSVATDCVLLTVDAEHLLVPVHLRENEPHKDRWALPGVFVGYDENGEDAVLRALKQKCGFSFDGYLEHLDWSWEPGRDPRGWVGTCAYLALAHHDAVRRSLPRRERVALARVTVPWRGEYGGPVDVAIDEEPKVSLAFDHDQLIGLAVKRLRAKLQYTGVALELMPEEFTLRQFQRAFEIVLGEELNRATFRHLVVNVLELVEPTGELEWGVGRPAELYCRSGDA